MTGSKNPQPRELDSNVLDSAVMAADMPADLRADVCVDGSSTGSKRVSPEQADQLVDQHYEVVYRYAYRLVGCVASAEDITQETFVQALRHLHQLRSAEAERGWLLAIARRQFMRVLRKVVHNKHGRLVSLDSPSADVDSALCDDPTSLQQNLDQQDAIQQALSQLGHDARLIVVMHYFEELSYAEIAAQLNIPIGTVMSRLSRSRDQLRKLLDEEAPHANHRNPLSSSLSPTPAHLPCNVTQEARHG